jgi:hypothetical protein
MLRVLHPFSRSRSSPAAQPRSATPYYRDITTRLLFQMDTEGTFQPAVVAEKMQRFPNGTEIPDLVQIVEYCVTQSGR